MVPLPVAVGLSKNSLDTAANQPRLSDERNICTCFRDNSAHTGVEASRTIDGESAGRTVAVTHDPDRKVGAGGACMHSHRGREGLGLE